MQIAKVSSNESFRSLKLTYSLANKLKSSSAKQIRADVKSIKNLLKEYNLHSKKYVDIVIDKNDYNEKFYAIISSKKQGVPMNPHNSHLIPTKNDKAGLKDLIEWVTSWDFLYSPEGLQEQKNWAEKALEILKNSRLGNKK